jgi:arsenite/tail-anchored protein-transporting ATPase
MATRILLISGKGGVGKTSVAAATALLSARAGARTLVMSFDLAHSLGDSFAVQAEVIGLNKGLSRQIEDRLTILEIDLYEELGRQWGDTFQLVSGLIHGGNSMQGALAADAGAMPGVEELIALHCLHQQYESGEYDLIVVDFPPTAEALGFVGFVSLLEFYVRKRLPVDRRFSRIARPIALSIDRSWEMFFPEERHFAVIEQIATRMQAINALLLDPAITTIRLVTNPEKMVVEETRRALMYFSMYGVTTDAVVMNRLLPDGATSYAQRLAAQASYLAEVEEDFAPIPTLRAPWMPAEVISADALAAFGHLLYGERDPRDRFVDTPAYRVLDPATPADPYRLQLRLPFAEKRDVDLQRVEQGLAIGIGPFRRVILLPRVLQSLPVQSARLTDDHLLIEFARA